MIHTSMINSGTYWDHRFSKDWEASEGPQQSRFFAELAIRHLPDWLLMRIKSELLTIVDWGCAQGDGTVVWTEYISNEQITGVDFSQVAIDQAASRYPGVRFISANWLAPNKASPELFDIVFSSNTLEHFHEPHKILSAVCRHASRAVVLALPYREVDRIAEHFYSFFPTGISLRLDNGFRLIWSRVIDCRQLPETQWRGDQIILVYASDKWTDELRLSLNDCWIDCEDRITESDRMVALFDESRTQLEEGRLAILELEQQTSALTMQMADKKNEISDLQARMADKENEISDLQARMGEVQKQYEMVMNSKSMKLTSFARSLRRKSAQGGRLLNTFARVAASQGLGYAISRARIRIQANASRPASSTELSLSDQERYTMERGAQNAHLANYLAQGIEPAQASLLHQHFLGRKTKAERIVVYPLSYPMELTQRPDHILRNFAENGYECIILSLDNTAPFFREISPNVYLTNLFAAAVSYFSSKEITFYITYPFFSYILNHLRGARVVYDVLDDLSVFSLNCAAMEEDHISLLARAEIALFSSQALFDANHTYVNGTANLVSNGVWVKDFEIESTAATKIHSFKKDPDEFVIGYHGAISELLDWELLDKLTTIPNLRLVMIGPVAQFDASTAQTSRALQDRVLASASVLHLQPVAYRELKYYLRGFDAAIVPFVVNGKTHPVSPLKLFEYMAMGLRVYATPTRTLLGYSEFIHVDDKANLPTLIAEAVKNKSPSPSHGYYDEVLLKADWGKQLSPMLALLAERNKTPVRLPDEKKKIDILNVNFFDWDGKILYKGGAERYVYDLACLLKEDGWQPRILQNANKPFELEFRGIPVVGVQTDSGHDIRGMSKKFRAACSGADFVVASPADLGCELWGMNVIGINHGIYWDHKFKKLETSNINEYRNIFDALKISSAVVAVDTNFINWVRTYDYSLGQKAVYVPNYFDGVNFVPGEKDFQGKIRILYPRRLYEARGIFLTLKAFDYLFKRHENIELHLVGQANSDDGRIVAEFVKMHKGRVLWEELDMDEMHKAYETSHIALVPTMYAEGTSLSCLEAMATNNAVIATNIGGLPNLVVDGFNGYLISPTVEALIQSIESLLADRRLMQTMAAKGIELASTFEKSRWISRWRNIITEATK